MKWQHDPTRQRWCLILAMCAAAFALILPACAVLAAGTAADVNALPAGEKEVGFVPLFNGRNLDGWTLDRSAKSPSFEVRKGLLYCTGGGDYETLLRTTRMYENFDLRLEYQTPGWTEGGVLFHVPPIGRATRLGVKIQIYHRIGDAHHEPNFSGSIFGVRSPEKDLARGSKDWQTLRILMDWPTLRVWLNGQLIHDLNCDEDEALKYRERTGYIALQDIKSDLYFRRIRVRELPPRDEWVTLFNGKDLTGWHEVDRAKWDVRMPMENAFVWTCMEHPKFRLHEFARCPYCVRNLVPLPKGPAWTCPMHKQIQMAEAGACPICKMKLVPVQGAEAEKAPAPLPGKIAPGVIHAEKSTGYLITDKKYQDFQLKTIIRESPGANGGVFFRWTREEDNDRGYEIQIRNSPDSSHPTGSIYKYDRCTDDEIIKGSEWYLMQLIVQGPHIQVWIDGKKISEIRDAKKKIPGQIALQMHSNDSWVEWRDIKIKELPAK